MLLKAWVIASSSDSSRAQSLVGCLKQQGVDAAWVNAVSGDKQVPKLQPGEKLAPLKSLFNQRLPLAAYDVARYLSHYRLIKKSFAQGATHVCILEDSVVLSEELGGLLHAISHLGEDAHMVRLTGVWPHANKALRKLNGDYRLVRLTLGADSALAYVLNREGMRRVLAAGSSIAMPINSLYDSYFTFGLRSFAVSPQAVCREDAVISENNDSLVKDQRPLVLAGWCMVRAYRFALRLVNVVIGYPRSSLRALVNSSRSMHSR